MEIILLLDVSLSVMNRSLLDVYTLKEELLDDLGEEVSVGIYAFANKLTRLTRPTRDLDKLQQALEKAYDLADGGTRLYEAVMQTSRDAASEGGEASRFLLVLSDGFPTGKAPPEYAVQVARMYGMPVYPIVLGHQKIQIADVAPIGGPVKLRSQGPALEDAQGHPDPRRGGR